MKSKQYAVVTRVASVYEEGQTRVRTYGPYDDRNEAVATARRLRRKALQEGWAYRAEISACTLLDGPEDE